LKIEDVALLARLQLSEPEKELFARQLKNTIDYINKLNELDTTEIEPTAHVLPIENVFREDVLRPSLSCDKALQNAPEREGNFYLVPRIIE
jgi:aspartyl-tRNA(Asn)/glutamyl-tRNA(Gln) amidotransferase subunit C